VRLRAIWITTVAALARGGKGAKNAENLKKNHVKIQIVSFICVCVQE